MRNCLLRLHLDIIESFLYDPRPYLDPGCLWHMHAPGEGSHWRAILATLTVLLGLKGLFPIPQPSAAYLFSVLQLRKSLEEIDALLEKPVNLRLLEPHRLSCPGCQPYKRLMQRLHDLKWRVPLVHLSENQKKGLDLRRKQTRACDPMDEGYSPTHRSLIAWV